MIEYIMLNKYKRKRKDTYKREHRLNDFLNFCECYAINIRNNLSIENILTNDFVINKKKMFLM